MREIPFGADLLDTARDILRIELLPALAPALRQQALMIANAMAIARRQLDDGDLPEQRELAALDALDPLLDVPPAARAVPHDPHQPYQPHEPQAGLQSELIVRNRRLCLAIRTGQADPGRTLHAGAHALLLDVAQAKVAQSNPRYLERQP